MTKEFIPYKQASAFKKLGYNERGFGFYEKKKLVISTWINSNSYLKIDFEKGKPRITAPTWSQAFRWFREKYNYNHSIVFTKHPFGTDEYQYMVLLEDDECVEINFKTYEKAELACLIKLIEIVKGGEQ